MQRDDLLIMNRRAVDSIIQRIRRTQQIGAGVAKRGTEGETSSDDAASLLGSSSMLSRCATLEFIYRAPSLILIAQVLVGAISKIP